MQCTENQVEKPQVWNSNTKGQMSTHIHTHTHTHTHTRTHTQTEEAGKLKEAMVTNHFPCSAITNNSTLHWGSLHPGLEWHLETVEGGPSSAALCCCYYYCLYWEQPISTHSGPPSAFHYRHLLKKLIKLLSHIRCWCTNYLPYSLGI